MNKSKLPGVGTSIFTVVSKMAKDNNAINLAQGFPNFPVDSILIVLKPVWVNTFFNVFGV